ncbi:MAG: glycosyltransferase family 4 protein [Candidatus Ratteibacteria bacterium]|nr:glycosyltransferase family 4 protein [Candidatus Ratteibacteria bacterium]
MKKTRKIFYITNTDWGLFNFRLPVLKALKNSGYEVGAIAKKGQFWDKLKTDIDNLIPLNHYRKGINPIRDILMAKELISIFIKYKPDIVHLFTAKPIIYGAIAAKIARISIIIATIPGLGAVFAEQNAKIKFIRNFIVIPLYKIIGNLCNFMFFQNEDDRNFFIRRGIITGNKSDIIAGSGVDTIIFSPGKAAEQDIIKLKEKLELTSDNVVIILVSRMLYIKGIEEYVFAAKKVRDTYPKAIFLLVGPQDRENPSAISSGQLKKWTDSEYIRYLGKRDDIRNLLEISDIAVLPSHGGEGVPKFLLEAAAMGKAIVTTDVHGCKDIVKRDRTGILIKPKDSFRLTKAIITLIQDKSLREKLGANARELALKKFDIKYVINKSMSKYEELAKKSKI